MDNVSKISIVAHSGYRGDERPATVLYKGSRYDVVELEDTWIAAGVDPETEVLRWYVVRCAGGARFRICHGEESGWQGDILAGPRLV